MSIEEKFFKTFGIEEQCICPYFPEYMENGCEICIKYFQGKKDCNGGKNRYKYPEITDRILLEMVCVLSQSYPLNYEGWSFYTVQELKETILEDCITTAKKLSLSSVFANNIQQLFKEVSRGE